LVPLAACHLARHEDIGREHGWNAPRQNVLVVALAGVEARERPQIVEVQPREHTPVAEFTVSKNLWEELMDDNV
jgi:hypothetical protein